MSRAGHRRRVSSTLPIPRSLTRAACFPQAGIPTMSSSSIVTSAAIRWRFADSMPSRLSRPTARGAGASTSTASRASHRGQPRLRFPREAPRRSHPPRIASHRGAPETEARRDEAEFFRGLISQRQVAGREGGQYLQILQQRARVPDQRQRPIARMANGRRCRASNRRRTPVPETLRDPGAAGWRPDRRRHEVRRGRPLVVATPVG